MDLATYATVYLPLAVVGIGASCVASALLARAHVRRSRERRALVLDEIRAQQPNGTGYTLSVGLEQRLGKRWPIASIYSHLIPLEDQGVIASRWGEATAERGWRRPRHYWVVADLPHLASDKD